MFPAVSAAEEKKEEKVKHQYLKPDFLSGVTKTSEVILKIKKEVKDSPEAINGQIKKLLNDLLNGPEQLAVDFSEPLVTADTDSVYYKEIKVNLSGAIFDDLKIETASIVFNEASFDLYKLFYDGKIKVTRSGEIRSTINIFEKDLNSYLIKKSEKIKVRNPFAKLENEELYIGGTFKQGIFVIDFRANGGFKIVDGSKIHFNIRRLVVNHMRMPGTFVRKVLEKINPILDIEKFPFKLIMKSIYVKNERLVFSSESR